MADRTRHLAPEIFIQSEYASAHVQGQYSLPPYGLAQAPPAMASQAFWFPTFQAQVEPKYTMHNYYQPEAVNPPAYYQQPVQPSVFNIQSFSTDRVTGFTPSPPYWIPRVAQEPMYWLIPPRDPPMMGNAESNRNTHLSSNSDTSGYHMGPPPVTQQPLDQLKCQLDRVNQIFRTRNLIEISKNEFLYNARNLFVDGGRWCNSDPAKFHSDYKQPLRELAYWLTMYFPGKFSKGEFDDILSLEDLEGEA